ncbi:MAG: hypothetical protein HYY78_24060 [Betaproteobacteria bacterium]|nr:hypothetical protein [Betaproteobacteria bacterium]
MEQSRECKWAFYAPSMAPSWQALFAPANTPPELVKQLDALIVCIPKTREAGDFFRQVAMWETMPMSLAELAAFVPAVIERWRTVVKRAGLDMQ